ncbi:MAG: hypothetical protein D6722_19175, partial [Bacteroidetes bacterium]
MKKHLLLFSSLFMLSAAGLTAQPVIDGIMNDADYVQVLTYSSTNDGFGAPSEFGAMYLYSDGTDIYLGITGQLEANGNRMVLFLDFSGPNGVASGVALPTGSTGFVNEIGGTVLPGEADIMLHANLGGTAPSPFFLDVARYDNTPSIALVGYINAAPADGSASVTGNLGAVTGGTGNMEFAYRSTFTTDNTHGWEMKMPIAAFAGVTNAQTLRVFAAFVNGTGNFWSNEFLPSSEDDGAAD